MKQKEPAKPLKHTRITFPPGVRIKTSKTLYYTLFLLILEQKTQRRLHTVVICDTFFIHTQKLRSVQRTGTLQQTVGTNETKKPKQNKRKKKKDNNNAFQTVSWRVVLRHFC